MTSASAPDPTDILKALEVQVVTSISSVQGGTDTAIWRVEHDSVISALRVFRPDQLTVCLREIEVMQTAHQAGVRVPAIRAHTVWQDRPALLLEWSHGEPLWDVIRRQPWRIWRLAQSFGQMQAHIHRIAMQPDWRYQRSDWIEWAGLDAAIQQNLTAIARPTPRVLHLDYHPWNVLADSTQITAVIDWANTRIGDPRADLARTYTILMVEPYMPGRQPLFLSLVRRLLCAGWQNGYARYAEPVTDMAWFYTWAGTVMVRDLASRVQNPASWWQTHHLKQIQDWAAMWKKRAEQETRIT
jgi:aminoglycoside phosphotransferase (APT) family kinase protein